MIDIRIAILPSGFIFVGHYWREDMFAGVRGGRVVRRYPAPGLGGLAANGPTGATLEPLPDAEWLLLREVATIRCDAAKWRAELGDAPGGGA